MSLADASKLSRRELAVLHVLLMAAPEAMYGRDIARQVYPRWMHWLLLDAIYVHLSRLEDRGLIVHRYEQVPLGYPGLPRYTYLITGDGRRECRRSLSRRIVAELMQS